MPEENSFSGEIRVSSRIVDYLSSGLYHSPAACLKELINNSFDADAKRVDVFVKPDADRIIIEDDGEGINRDVFVKHFSRISESHKRDDSDYTRSGRPKIGKIGIGFIAANEICDVMEIESTQKGSPDLLEVTINFDLMRQDISNRKRTENEFAKADYEGTVSQTDIDSHYTRVFLKRVRGEAKSILSGVGASQYSSGKRNLYGLKPESEFKELKDEKLKTWSEFNEYSKNRLEVALNVPVRYHNGWVPQYLKSSVASIEQHVEELNFSVFFDGSEIRKPIVYNPVGKALISPFDFNGEHVSANGYFYAQHGSLKPEELHGILIRIRNSAVGEFDPSFLGFSLTQGSLFQNWISAEISADDRLEEALNIDRRTLRIAHPAYMELQKAIHTHLEKLIKRIRSEIYITGSNERKITRATKVQQDIMKVANEEMIKVSSIAAKQVNTAWSNIGNDQYTQRKILYKYSVNEVYDIVIEIAKELLSPTQFDEFISKLTKRLKG